MDIYGVFNAVGGLALFLYGMDVLSKSLSKSSGGKLENILEKLTTTKFKAVLFGAAVTAVIQSSSATTVMVVGFVNSGIMKLNQAVGIIMGANIGTTITSWILGLTGIQSTNFLVSLFKPSTFAPIVAMAGVLLLLFSKKGKDIGSILVGFAILLIGMNIMSSALKPLAELEWFSDLMVSFSNPILGLLIGLLVTAVIQSSSASVGILQALCSTGIITYATALPIIMGQNIGTCVTAMLSSIGAKKNAKKAALIHLYFNVIGSVSFMILFYTLNSFLHFTILGQNCTEWGIAIIHTTFNLLTTIVLLPFSDYLVKLADLTLSKQKISESDTNRLEIRFLNNPSFALELAYEEATAMSVQSADGLNRSLELFARYDESQRDDIQKIEDIVDEYEDNLNSYLQKVSGHDLNESDTKKLNLLIHCIGNFERISDHATNIMCIAEKMNKIEINTKIKREIEVFGEAVKEIVRITIVAFASGNTTDAKKIEPLEETIDDLCRTLKEKYIRRLSESKYSAELGFLLSDLISNFERIGDHCSNIAVYLLQSQVNDFDTHEYLDKIRYEDDENFKELYMMYKEKFQLPQ